MLLKANLHLHSAEDPEDALNYNIYKAISKAADLNFKILGWTCHNKVVYEEKHGLYAQEKGIILIPGIEKDISDLSATKIGKHVVILNCAKDVEKIVNFSDLREYKRGNPQILVLAPHSFFPSKTALQSDLEKNIDIFDAIELSWYYTKSIDFNQRAKIIAEKYKKPFIATSDTHDLTYLNTSYALIDIETSRRDVSMEINSIIKAVKQCKFKNVSKPISLWEAAWFQLKFMKRPQNIKRKLKRRSL